MLYNIYAKKWHTSHTPRAPRVLIPNNMRGRIYTGGTASYRAAAKHQTQYKPLKTPNKKTKKSPATRVISTPVLLSGGRVSGWVRSTPPARRALAKVIFRYARDLLPSL